MIYATFEGVLIVNRTEVKFHLASADGEWALGGEDSKEVL